MPFIKITLVESTVLPVLRDLNVCPETDGGLNRRDKELGRERKAELRARLWRDAA